MDDAEKGLQEKDLQKVGGENDKTKGVEHVLVSEELSFEQSRNESGQRT